MIGSGSWISGHGCPFGFVVFEVGVNGKMETNKVAG